MDEDSCGKGKFGFAVGRSFRVWMIYVLILIGVGVCVWLRSEMSIPQGDDMVYSYRLEPGMEATLTSDLPAIESLGDLISSQKVQYREVNGRVPVHFLVQAFDGFHAQSLFCVLNSVVFCVTVVLLCNFVRVRRRPNLFLLSVIFFIMLVLMPEASTIYYLPTLSINYLWVLCMSLCALEIWRGSLIWLAPMMLIAGWSHEAFSIPIAGAMVVRLLSHPREIVGKRGVIAFFYGLGVTVLFCAPGNFLRLEAMGGDGTPLAAVFHRVINLFDNGWLDVAVICFICYMIRHGRREGRIYLKEMWGRESFLLCIIGFSILFLFAFGGLGGRGGFALSVFTVLLLLRQNKDLLDRLDRPAACSAVIAVLAIQEGVVIDDRIREKKRFDSLIEAYLRAEDGIVGIEESERGQSANLFGLTDSRKLTVRSDDDYDRLTRVYMALYYDHPERRPLITLPMKELEDLRRGEFDDSLRIAGSAGAYRAAGWDHIVRPVGTGEVSDIEGEPVIPVYDLQDPERLSFRDRLKIRAGRMKESETVKTVRIKTGERVYDLIYVEEPVMRVESLRTE